MQQQHRQANAAAAATPTWALLQELPVANRTWRARLQECQAVGQGWARTVGRTTATCTRALRQEQVL
jgi:hypothetical protein